VPRRALRDILKEIIYRLIFRNQTMARKNVKRFKVGAGLLLLLIVAASQLPRMSARIPENSYSSSIPLVKPTVELYNWKAEDQDEFCLWRNRDNPESSYIISSDKTASKLFSYDLQGNKVDEIYVSKPGNIDIAYGFPLGNSLVDIIVVNQRREPRELIVCTISKKNGQLTRIDHHGLPTGKNYGGCLCYNKETGKFYFISTSKTRGITQYELYDNNGIISSKPVRSWKSNISEGVVSNDKKGILYIAEELRGVRKMSSNPNQETAGELIIKTDENNLVGDVEGIALLNVSENESYLVLSDQDTSTFKVYREEEGYPFVGDFKVEGAIETDGIEIIRSPLGSQFPHGLFLCHTDKRPRPVLMVPLERVLTALNISE
jgi:3-phytase